MASPTTAASGVPSPRLDHRQRLRHLLAAQAHRPPLSGAGAAASTRASAAPGAASFQFDRELGVRCVAGADEAGRGCLAGPLVAAAVLFDLERLGVREVRALGALNDSKQHDAEAREELYPLVLRTAAKVASSRAARAGSTPAACTARTSPRCATRCIARRPARRALPRRRLPVPDFGHEQRADRRRRRDERGDRRRVDRRQGHARPLHAPRRRAASRAGSSPRTSATRRPSTARRSSASASRRCTACRSSAWPTSSSRCSAGARIRTPPRGGRGARAGPAASTTHADRVEAQLRRARALVDLGRGRRRAIAAHLRAACARAAPPTAPRPSRVARRVLTSTKTSVAAVADDEVDLAVARAVVAGDERVARAARGARARGARRGGRGADGGRADMAGDARHARVTAGRRDCADSAQASVPSSATGRARGESRESPARVGTVQRVSPSHAPA